MNYHPDNWVVLKIQGKDETIYKVLAGWSGGYLDGDAWKINSGITKCEVDGDSFAFHGYSGSVYYCYKEAYRLSMATAGVFEQIKTQFGPAVEMMDADTDWLSIDYV